MYHLLSAHTLTEATCCIWECISPMSCTHVQYTHTCNNYTQKSKGVNCVSHVALVKMESQTAIDSAYMKGRFE